MSSSTHEPLPHAPIGMVLGLLDHLRERPGGREDLYKLGGPLGYEIDELLPATEAAKRLGFVRIAAGDIELTDEGRALAAAEEKERKQRIRTRVLGLPLVAEIHARYIDCRIRDFVPLFVERHARAQLHAGSGGSAIRSSADPAPPTVAQGR